MKVAMAAFFVVCWEVVQLAVHQILDLIILVRVQASQPIFLTPQKRTLRTSTFALNAQPFFQN